MCPSDLISYLILVIGSSMNPDILSLPSLFFAISSSNITLFFFTTLLSWCVNPVLS